eukprot:5850897-Amphidinium_carterae.1
MRILTTDQFVRTEPHRGTERTSLQMKKFQNVPPPAPSSSSGGRRDEDIERESVRAVPPTSSAGSASGERAPSPRDRAPGRETQEEQTIMARTDEAEPKPAYRPANQGERPT